MSEVVWRSRKRVWCGLPWTFTIYSFDKERLYIESGFLNQRQDEVRLYRIMDLSLTRSLGQRIFGMGTIHVSSSDKTLKNFDLVNVKDCKGVKEMLANLIEEQRDKKRIYTRESLSSDAHDDDDYNDDDQDDSDDDDGDSDDE